MGHAVTLVDNADGRVLTVYQANVLHHVAHGTPQW